MPPKSIRNVCVGDSAVRLQRNLQDKRREKDAMTKHIRFLEQKLRRRRQREVLTVAALSESLKWILLMLYVFGGYSVVCAEAYWVQRRRRKRLAAYPRADTSRVIEDIFLQSQTAQLWETIEGETGKHKYARQQAFAWHAKYNLQKWVREKNVKKGLAVPSHMVKQHYNGLLDDIPFDVRPRELGDPRSECYCRIFLHRWRRNFKTKWGRVRVQEVLPLEEKRGKVPFFFTFRAIFGTSSGQKKTEFLAPKRGTKNSPRFWDLLMEFLIDGSTFGGYFWFSVLGPPDRDFFRPALCGSGIMQLGRSSLTANLYFW